MEQVGQEKSGKGKGKKKTVNKPIPDEERPELGLLLQMASKQGYDLDPRFALRFLKPLAWMIVPAWRDIMNYIDKHEAQLLVTNRVCFERERIIIAALKQSKGMSRSDVLKIMEEDELDVIEFGVHGWESSPMQMATERHGREQAQESFDLFVEEAQYRVTRARLYAAGVRQVEEGKISQDGFNHIMRQFDGLKPGWLNTQTGVPEDAPGLTGRGQVLKVLGYPKDGDYPTANSETGEGSESNPSNPSPQADQPSAPDPREEYNSESSKSGETWEGEQEAQKEEAEILKQTQHDIDWTKVADTAETVSEPGLAKATQFSISAEQPETSVDSDELGNIENQRDEPSLEPSNAHLPLAFERLVIYARIQRTRAHRGFGIQLDIGHNALPQGNANDPAIAIITSMQAEIDSQAEEIRKLKAALAWKNLDPEAEVHALQQGNNELMKHADKREESKSLEAAQQLNVEALMPTPQISGPSEESELEAERAQALHKVINFDRETRQLHDSLFEAHAKHVGAGIHFRDDFELFAAEDIAHFQIEHTEASEAFARTMIALAGGSAALAAALWHGMELRIRGFLMNKGVAFNEISQKHLDNELSRFAMHFNYRNCSEEIAL